MAGPVLASELPLPPILGASEAFVSDWRGALALGGADPVAYLTEGAVRPGQAQFETTWRGLAWRFGSAANRSVFTADPASFAPRFGGYDAAMMARGVLVEADPALFAVAAGRLFLFRSEANRHAFMADPALAESAERNWTLLRAALPQD